MGQALKGATFSSLLFSCKNNAAKSSSPSLEGTRGLKGGTKAAKPQHPPPSTKHQPRTGNCCFFLRNGTPHAFSWPKPWPHSRN